MVKYDKTSVKQINTDPETTNAYRFMLTIELKNSNQEEYIVILQNPAKANKKVSDGTINNVISKLYDSCGKLTIFNLCPYYASKPTDLEQSQINDITINNQNINKFKTYLDSKEKQDIKILLAWGNTDKPNVATKKAWYDLKQIFLKIIKENKNITCFSYGELLDDTPTNPRHFSTQSLNQATPGVLQKINIVYHLAIESDNK